MLNFLPKVIRNIIYSYINYEDDYDKVMCELINNKNTSIYVQCTCNVCNNSHPIYSAFSEFAIS